MTITNNKLFACLLGLLLCCANLHAQGNAISENLEGIYFFNSSNSIERNGVAVPIDSKDLFARVRFFDVHPPNKRGLANKLEPFLNNPLGMGEINELKQIVLAHYNEKELPVVDVFVPEQEVTNNIVQLVLLESKVGQVKIEGNKHFSTELLREQIRIASGEAIDMERIDKDVARLNNNPYRVVDLIYEKGQAQGTTDIVVNVEDQFPMKFTLGYDDTGNKLTKDRRYNASWDWGNVFGLDHQFNYMFQGDPNFDLLKSHSAGYIIPLKGNHTLNISGSYATNGALLGVPGLDIEGESWSITTLYTMPLSSSIEDYTHSVSLAHDFKRSNTDILLNQIRNSTTTTDVFQFTANYNGVLTDKWGTNIFDVSVIHSPGNITHNNGNDDLSAAGAASANYTYAKLNIMRMQQILEQFSLTVNANYQWADKNLPGSEKMGFGGWMDLVGYDEREANGDEGLYVTAKLAGPTLTPSSWIKKEWGDSFTPHISFGYGTTSPKSITTEGEDANIDLMSVGPGFSYNFSDYLSARFDYGWQLKDSNTSSATRNPHNSRGHFGLTLSY